MWEVCWKNKNDHLRLAFGCEGGGGGGRGVGRTQKNHLQLAFKCEGGGGGGEHVETTKKATSSSCLDAREVVLVADSQNDKKKTTSSSH